MERNRTILSRSIVALRYLLYVMIVFDARMRTQLSFNASIVQLVTDLTFVSNLNRRNHLGRKDWSLAFEFGCPIQMYYSL
jgi:predicted branched-subunit amino acid permease